MRLLVLVLTVIMVMPSAHAADDDTVEQPGEKLVPMAAAEREAAVRKVVADRDKKITVLITVLGVTNKLEKLPDEQREREACVIRLLGELRAEEAVGPLLDRVNRTYHGGFTTLASNEDVVLMALKKIGKPASLAALAYIAKEEKKERIKRYVAVMAEIEGKELAMEMIRLKAVKEKDAQRKKRLNESIELLYKQ